MSLTWKTLIWRSRNLTSFPQSHRCSSPHQHLRRDTSLLVSRRDWSWTGTHHPVRELAVYLSGEGEIEASDGTTRSIDPGTILLVDYTTGKGHRTRVTGSDEVLVVITTLPNDPAP